MTEGPQRGLEADPLQGPDAPGGGRAVQTTVQIPAPPEAVWAVLADTAGWAEWNPMQPGFACALAPGAKGRIAVRLLGITLWVPIQLDRVEPGRALSWRGGVPRVFTAVHGFVLSPTPDGTRVDHIERFTGIIPALFWWALKPVLMPGYRQTNAALVDRVGAAGASSTA